MSGFLKRVSSVFFGREHTLIIATIGRRGILLVLYADNVILDVFFVKQLDIRQEGKFNFDDLKNFFKKYPKIPVYVVFDTDQQYFVTKNVPKQLTGRELKAFLNNKLKTDIPYSGLKAYRRIASEPNSKTDEYLLVCMAITQNVEPFLSFLNTTDNPIFGFSSEAIELFAIYRSVRSGITKIAANTAKASSATGFQSESASASFTYDATKKLGAPTQQSSLKDWSIILTMSETRGLRQVVTLGDSFVLTRTMYFDDLYSELTREEVHEEIESTISYVEKASFLPRSKIIIRVFGSLEFLQMIQSFGLQVKELDTAILQDFIAKLPVKNLAKQYNFISTVTIATAVYVRQFLNIQNPVSHACVRFFLINKILKKSIMFISISLLIVGLLMFFRILQVNNTIKNLENKRAKLSQEYSRLSSAKSVSGDLQLDEIVKLIDFYSTIPNSQKVIDLLLEAHQFMLNLRSLENNNTLARYAKIKPTAVHLLCVDKCYSVDQSMLLSITLSSLAHQFSFIEKEDFTKYIASLSQNFNYDYKDSEGSIVIQVSFKQKI